jgi:hypothetical protein
MTLPVLDDSMTLRAGAGSRRPGGHRIIRTTQPSRRTGTRT